MAIAANQRRTEIGVRAVFFLLGGSSVASLLGWVFGLGSFHTWFLAVSVPGQVLLAVVGVWLARRDDLVELRSLLMAGLVGGVVGTVGYDLFRVPFALAGLQVFAPIDSYGVLALGAVSSSPLTGFVGWAYHFANGIGFGLSYAALAGRGRHWSWGVAWALLLETATLVTPFAATYALSGKWVPIAIAYAAHIPYGLAIGLAVRHSDRVADELRAMTRWSVPGILIVTFGVLAVWHLPWTSARPIELGSLADPAAVVRDGKFQPLWLRVAPGGCVTLRNLDSEAYRLNVGVPQEVRAGADTSVCFADKGVHRVRTTSEPYSGGFVIVDPNP